MVTPESVSTCRNTSPEKLRRTLSGDLDEILLKALRKEPQRRYSSVQDFASDLRSYSLGLPVSARGDAFGYRSSKFIQRNKLSLAVTAVFALVVTAGVVAIVREARIARIQQARAEQRFNDVRKLANSFMFDFDGAIKNLPGSTRARELVVTAALQYLDSLAQESKDDRSLQSELATAYEKVGNIQGVLAYQNLGNTSGALESYRKALKIRESLAQLDVSDRTAHRDLAIAHARIGGILSHRNDFAEASQSYSNAINIFEALANSPKSDPKAPHDLAVAYDGLADHFFRKGDFSHSVDNYRKAIPVFEKLSAADPRDQEVRLDLASTYRHTAVALNKLGDQNSALDFTQKALVINQDVAKATPANVRAQLDLAAGYGDLSSVLISRGDMGGAIKNRQMAVDIWQALATADPSDARAKIGLANDYARLGWLQVKAGQTTDIGNLLKALEIRQKMHAADPKDGGRKEALAESYEALAEAEVFLASRRGLVPRIQKQHWSKALSWYKQASDTFLELRAQGMLRGTDALEPDAIALAIAKCNAALAKPTAHNP
jgi:tetratricopeptide (TPR) repeat protein